MSGGSSQECFKETRFLTTFYITKKIRIRKMTELRQRDRVRIKSLGVDGTVIGRVLMDHNKGKVGDLIVDYEIVSRNVVQRFNKAFPPDDLDLVFDNRWKGNR